MTANARHSPLTPPFEPPYYAVIFTSLRTPIDEHYAEIAEQMVALAAGQPGYLGMDTARDPVSGVGITVSYWRDAAAIAAWKRHGEHLLAQRQGRETWYEAFVTHVTRVERSYGFQKVSV